MLYAFDLAHDYPRLYVRGFHELEEFSVPISRYSRKVYGLNVSVNCLKYPSGTSPRIDISSLLKSSSLIS